MKLWPTSKVRGRGGSSVLLRSFRNVGNGVENVKKGDKTTKYNKNCKLILLNTKWLVVPRAARYFKPGHFLPPMGSPIFTRLHFGISALVLRQ